MPGTVAVREIDTMVFVPSPPPATLSVPASASIVTCTADATHVVPSIDALICAVSAFTGDVVESRQPAITIRTAAESKRMRRIENRMECLMTNVASSNSAR